MKLINCDRSKLEGCCQMRYDGFKKVDESEKKKDGVPVVQARNNELFTGFQSLVIGNMLLENMGKETCLDCLHFRHKGLNYYATYKAEGKRFKENLERQILELQKKENGNKSS